MRKADSGRPHGNYDGKDKEHCCSCGKETNYLMENGECMRCWSSYASIFQFSGIKDSYIKKEQ